MSDSEESPLVVHVIYSLGTGGLENGLVNILNRFPRQRYRHTIVCLTTAGAFADRLARDDIEVLTLDKNPGHDIGMYWRLWKLLKVLQPAILHTRNMAALETQLLTLFMPRIKSVHGEHGRDVHDLDGSNRKYIMLRRLLQPLVDRYIAVSADLEEWLHEIVRLPEKKIRQIYNGVDSQKFRPGEGLVPMGAPRNFFEGTPVVVGTVGRVAAVKDQATLLRAISLLLDSRPELVSRIRVMVVGDGPLLGDLRQLVSEAEIKSIVWFTGDRTDTPDMLRAMDIFVLPSLGEGISNTILEAMATGLPIIATRVGGNPELVEEGVNGQLVDVAQPSQLASAIESFVEAGSLREQMGRRSREKVLEKYSWSNTVDNYLSVYDELLGFDGAVN